MANRSAILTIKILSDASKASKGVNQAAGGFGKFESAARKAAVPAAAVGGALLLVGKQAVEAASRTQQAMGGLDAVFGKNAGQVKQWAAGAANSVGLAKSTYGELATLIGSQLKNAGLPMDQVTKKTGDLIAMGADLAAMYGGTTAEAVDALSSALKGEMDPLEKYGTSLSQAKIQAELAAKGQDKLTGKAAAQAKTMATLSLITKQTADAHGAAAREYDSAASAQQRMNAQVENAMSDIGTVLLPVVSMLASALGKVAVYAGKNTTVIQILAGVVAALAGAVLLTNAALSVYAAATTIATAVSTVFGKAALGTRLQLAALAVWQKAVAVAQWAMNSAFLASPITWIVLLVIALAAAFVLLYKRSKTFRDFVNAMWAAVKSGATAAANVVKAVWRVVWALLSAYVRVYAAIVRAVFAAIRSVASSVANVVRAVWRAVWAAVGGYVRAYGGAVKAGLAVVRGAVSNVVAYIRSAFKGVWSAVESAARTAAGVLSKPFAAVESAIRNVISAVESLIGWLSRIHVPKISLPHLPKGLHFAFNAAPSPASTTAGPGGFRASGMVGRGSSSSSTPIVVNVSGALDPEGVARQIRRILTGHDQRVGITAATR